MHGRKVQLPLLPSLEIENVKTYDGETCMNYLNTHVPIVHSVALDKIKKAQAAQKKFYDKKLRIKKDYQVGELVARKVLEKSSFPAERFSGPWVLVAPNNKKKKPLGNYTSKTT